MNRKNLLHAIRLLARADLVFELFKPNRGIGAFSKPEKLYLHNTNLIVALDKDHYVKGTLRETFFGNQLAKSNTLNFVEKGDFLIDTTFIFEIGGKSKIGKKNKDIPDAYVIC